MRKPPLNVTAGPIVRALVKVEWTMEEQREHIQQQLTLRNVILWNIYKLQRRYYDYRTRGTRAGKKFGL